MHLAIVQVFFPSTQRFTDFNSVWLDKVLDHCREYFLTQSGGAVTLAHQVFEPFQISVTPGRWAELGDAAAELAIDEAVQRYGFPKSAYDLFIVVPDKPSENSGKYVPGTKNIFVGAIGLDPALIQHELGHPLGAEHAWVSNETGFAEYDDPFCVMGREGSKLSHKDPRFDITLLGSPRNTDRCDTGPGMIAPNLIRCGWLDVAKNGVDISSALANSNEAVFEIRSLEGAPRNSRETVVAYSSTLVPQQMFTIEYRLPRGHDEGLSAIRDADLGVVVCHILGSINLQIGWLIATPGGTIHLREPGVRLTVLESDTAAGNLIFKLTKEPWRKWFNLTGSSEPPAAGNISVCARTPDNLDIAGVGYDGHIWGVSWEQGRVQWTNPAWLRLENGSAFKADADIQIISRKPAQMDVFSVQADQTPVSYPWTIETGWIDKFAIGEGVKFLPTRCAAAVRRGEEHLDIFQLGFDGNVWSTFWPARPGSAEWYPWFRIRDDMGLSFPPDGQIEALSRKLDHLDLFVVGKDGNVWSTWWDASSASGWYPWFRIESEQLFATTQRVAAVARKTDNIDLFCVAPDGVLWRAAWRLDRSGWGSWQPIDDTKMGGNGRLRLHADCYITVVSRDPERFDVFGTDTAGGVWSNAWHSGDGWSGWFALEPDRQFRPGSRVHCVSRWPDRLDLFAVSKDGHVWSTYWQPV